MYISVPPQYYIDRIKDNYPEVRDYINFIDINLINAGGDWLSPILNKKIVTIHRHHRTVVIFPQIAV